MIATDTSSLVAYLQGATGDDVEKLDAASSAGDLVLPPVVVTEILSDPASAKMLNTILPEIQMLELTEGYWARAGHARLTLKRQGLKTKIADALIAQSCIDHSVALITRDADFRHFAKHCGLRLA
jgi:predicted nucleic acid-binding protein